MNLFEEEEDELLAESLAEEKGRTTSGREGK